MSGKVEGFDQPTGRTGGIYIPPFKLALMNKDKGEVDKSSKEYQKQTWEALRKSLNGVINKVNVANIKEIVGELFQENLVRGRGLFARAIMKAQLASPGFTPIYTALIAVINTKLPENGELILKRVVYSFNRAYKRRDKMVATGMAKFIAHLVNFQIAHELVALQLLTVLLEEPTDDSVEIAVNFVKEVGQLLEELSPQGMHAIFERFRAILQEGDIDKRVQYTIEGLFAIRKSQFKDFPTIPKDLDLVEREDQITFDISLDDEIDREEMLDIFRYDEKYLENEEMWNEIKKEILGDDEEEEEGEGVEYTEDMEGIEEGGGEAIVEVPEGETVDMTEQDLVNLRRTLYLTIMSSVSFEECSHKIAKLKIPDGYESELCNMLVECCANEKSYLRYYGLMGQRFCMMHRKYQDAFDVVFMNQYATIHRLETNKLRNVAKFFAHLLATDAMPWTCFEYIKLNENDTTSSSRIFIKIVIQELAEIMGLNTIKSRFMDAYMSDIFSGLFPKDSARNTRFAINFFTSIGLGALTDDLREHLKNAPKLLALQLQQQAAELQQQQALMAAEKKARKARIRAERDAARKNRGSGSGSSSSGSSSSGSDSDSDSSSGSSSSGSSSSGSRSSSGSSSGSSRSSRSGSSRSRSYSDSDSSSGSSSSGSSSSGSSSSGSRSSSGSSSRSSRSSRSGSRSSRGSRNSSRSNRNSIRRRRRRRVRSRSDSEESRVVVDGGRERSSSENKRVPPHRRRRSRSIESLDQQNSPSPVSEVVKPESNLNGSDRGLKRPRSESPDGDSQRGCYGGGDRDSRRGYADRYGGGDRDSRGGYADRYGGGDRDSRRGYADRYGGGDRDSRGGYADRYGGGDRDR